MAVATKYLVQRLESDSITWTTVFEIGISSLLAKSSDIVATLTSMMLKDGEISVRVVDDLNVVQLLTTRVA